MAVFSDWGPIAVRWGMISLPIQHAVFSDQGMVMIEMPGVHEWMGAGLYQMGDYFEIGIA